MGAMFDAVKMRFHDQTARRIREHPLLQGRWRSRGEGKSGRERFIAEYGQWTFLADPERCWGVKGSFHFAHHGGVNHTDFTYSQFTTTVDELCTSFGLHPASLSMHKIEVGVNVEPPIATKDLLPCVVMHRGVAATSMRKGRGINLVHAEYRVKVYDKAYQYGLDGELCRCEVHVNKMRALQRYGMKTLADLLEPATWLRLQPWLLQHFEDVLFVEPMRKDVQLSTTDRDLLLSAHHPAYWKEMRSSTRLDRKKRLARLTSQHGCYRMKRSLVEAMAKKLEQLLDVDEPDVLTGVRPEVVAELE